MVVSPAADFINTRIDRIVSSRIHDKQVSFKIELSSFFDQMSKTNLKELSGYALSVRSP